MAPSQHVVLVHAQDVLPELKVQAKDWDIWSSDQMLKLETTKILPDGTSTFPYEYAENHEERVLIISGKAELTPTDGSDKVQLGPGDYAVFGKGFSCTWHILEPVKKRFAYFDETDQKVDDTSGITCDVCGEECWDESYLCQPGDADLCPDCFMIKGSTYESAERQEEGEHVEDVEIPTNKMSRAERAAKRKTAPRGRSSGGGGSDDDDGEPEDDDDEYGEDDDDDDDKPKRKGKKGKK